MQFRHKKIIFGISFTILIAVALLYSYISQNKKIVQELIKNERGEIKLSKPLINSITTPTEPPVSQDGGNPTGVNKVDYSEILLDINNISLSQSQKIKLNELEKRGELNVRALLFGKVTDIKNEILFIQEVFPYKENSKLYPLRTFKIHTNQKTVYSKRIHRKNTSTTVLLFDSIHGKKEDIKVGSYVSVSTSENPNKILDLTALNIHYFDKKPLK